MSSINTIPAADTDRISVESELRRMNAYIRVMRALQDKECRDLMRKQQEQEAEGGDQS